MGMNAAKSVQALHDRCAIYTAAATAAKLLDLAGWTADADLTNARLLEPCAGEGAILIEAIDRLLEGLRRRSIPLSRETLTDRITSFEIHPTTANIARGSVVRRLKAAGLSPALARWLAQTWLVQDDFLMTPPVSATHVVANPPYVRWSKLPGLLAATYRAALRPEATRGDLSVAFIDRMLDWADADGQVVALVSDRWMFAQYAAAFVAQIAERGWGLRVLDERPPNAFVREVGAYSAIVKFRRGGTDPTDGAAVYATRQAERRMHNALLAKYGTIVEAGCTVRVGPALGCGDTYIVDEAAGLGIEAELLRPYIGRQNLLDGRAVASGSVVAVPYDRHGKPIQLADWPGFAAWISQHKAKLSKRSCVRPGGTWWRTIDAIGSQWAQSPKLLIPELCNRPRATLDCTASIPAHSLYAVWSTEWPIVALQRVLNGGLLRITAEAQAPMLKHGWFRFYRRFLVQTPLPKWATLSTSQRDALVAVDKALFDAAFLELFGFLPDPELPSKVPRAESPISTD